MTVAPTSALPVGEHHVELSTVEEWREEIYAAFAEWGTLVSYPRRSLVFVEGGLPTAAYALKSGLVGTTSIGADGREIFNTLRHARDVFGLAELILRRPRSRNAVVLDAAELWVVPPEPFLALVSTRPEIVLALLGSAYSRWTTLNHMRVDRAGGSARRRVASALCYLAQSRSAACAPSSAAPLRITHETVANLCGLSRQTVTTVLAQLEAMRLVELGFRSIRVIDDAGLESVVASTPTDTQL